MAPAGALAVRPERGLIVGLGGLGCPASLALAQGGVRRFTFIDPDRVDVSNLHRQPWYRTDDLGAEKVLIARRRLVAAFPDAQVEALPERVTAENVSSLLGSHDVTVDGTDSIATKFLLSDAGVLTGRPVVYGGVLRMEGQVMLIRRGGPCLRCLFEQPNEDDVPTCAQAGVLGSVAGLIGAWQAQAALRCLDEPRSEPQEMLSIFDAHRMLQRRVVVKRAVDCPSCAEGRGVVLQEPEAPRC